MLTRFFSSNPSMNATLKRASSFAKVSSFATVDPDSMSASNKAKCQNLVGGEWKDTENWTNIVDPLNGEEFLQVPNTSTDAELADVKESLLQCPIYGLHNPFHNPERYNLYGDISFKVAASLRDPEVLRFFERLIQRVTGKSDAQSHAEVVVTRRALENFSGDGPRFITKGFTVAGDHKGQQSQGYRWPYGPCAIISPFNFPFEIPVLQAMGALITGNKPLLKLDCRTSIVMEQYIRLMIECGMPADDVVLMHADGQNTNTFMERTPEIRLTQFTGSNKVADHLTQLTNGKIRIEDAGFDWKVLGPGVMDIDYIAWQCDQDAYAFSGQKCSAQSILFAHEDWMEAGIIEKLASQAGRRNIEDRSSGPVLTWNNDQIQAHVDNCLAIPGAKLLFGGKPYTGHQIPDCYGAYEPTAVYVPLSEIKAHWETVTTELFGPFQIVTSFADGEDDIVIDMLNSFKNHLTAGIVSGNPEFLYGTSAKTVNGVTYFGKKARTTGAPTNHWFGPAGDPRGAGIGTPEAICHTWTTHREVVRDIGPLDDDWTLPKPN